MLLGLLVFTRLHAQTDSVATRLSEQLEEISSNHHYTNPDSALLLYRQLANEAEQQSQWLIMLNTEIHIAWCALQHQQLDTLASLIRRAEASAQTHQVALDSLDPDHSLRLNIPYTWGLYYSYTEDRIRAIQVYQRLLQTQGAFTDSSLVSATYYSMAVSYRRLGNYQQAIAYHQLATAWIPKQGNERNYWYEKALGYRSLGKSYHDLSQHRNDSTLSRQAKELLMQSLGLLKPYERQEKRRHALITGYSALAGWHNIEGDYDSALYYLQGATKFFRPPESELIYVYVLWGDVYLAKNHPEKAVAQYQTALDIATQSYGLQHPVKASVFNHMATASTAQGHWPEVLSYSQEAMQQSAPGFAATADHHNPTLAQFTSLNRYVLETLLLKGNALYQLNQRTPSDTASLRQAIDSYQLATELIDRMRQTFPSLEYKQFISAKSATLYEQAIRASLRAHQLGLATQDFVAEAFYFSEKSKASTLLEAVKDSEARSFAQIPAELLEQENELKRNLTYWENELYQTSDDSLRQTLRARTLSIREDYNALIKRLETEYPNYYQLKYDTKVTGLRELQRRLPQGTSLLSFSYGDSTLYTFAIRADDVQWRTTPLDSNFHRSLASVLRSVSQYDYQQASDLSAFRAFTHDAHGLYQTLLAPWLSEEDKTKQLIIIPDGLLGYLPFDVLLTEEIAPTRVDYQSLPYLVKQLPVSYEYSATLLTTPAPPSDEVPYAYLGFAPSYPEAPLAESREVRTTLDGKQLGLGQLRHNREEIAFAAQLFRGQTFINEAATEAQFKQYAPQSRVLHLSMHAYANNENDDFSGLIFTQPLDTVPEDGFLHANELYNLSLHSELAVLSACETGIGTLAPGEGIMSLGRAFKYAGCPNVTMSLWNADDQSTSQIMQHFFGHLHNGSAKDRALRTAKLDYLEGTRSAQAHPYYWAAFVQVGNSDPLSTVGDFSGWWWVAGALVMLALLLWVLRRRRARVTL